MVDPWQLLRDAGLPLATPRRESTRDPVEIAHAVRQAIGSQPQGREAEALAALIFAWAAHWPSSFSRALGDAEIAWADQHALDPARYLKLRRIAIANLAEIL